MVSERVLQKINEAKKQQSRKLNLSYQGLTQIPDIVFELSSLTELNLSENQLTNIPESITKLTSLTTLNLSENQLTNIPESIGKLTNLTTLNLYKNQLTNMPESIGKLTNLIALDLGDNKLTNTPESIGKLTNLTTLHLDGNQLKKIPSWLVENKLEIEIENKYKNNCLNLSGNPIEEPPLEVVKQGNQAILNYYSQIATQGQDYLYEAKMLIVGEGGAGKTTLAHKIQENNCPLPKIDDRTKGITINNHSFSVKAKNENINRPFQLNIWDFGGQEIYHATHRFFLSKRSLYVLVADNREDNTDFNYWLNIIELFAGNSPVIIVLNEKDDLQRKINSSDLKSRYSETLKEICSLNFKTYEEIDLEKQKQRLNLIRKLISDIEYNAYKLPHIGEPVPALWVDIRQAVENDSRDYIYAKDFDEICYKQKLTDDQDIKTLLGYFHDLGIVLHFADNPLLRDRVILKPAWATNAVYRIFDNDRIKAKQGRFSKDDCFALWNDEQCEYQYKHMHDVLIELMKNFRLIYEIGNTGNLIAPQMLSKDTPEDIPLYNQNDLNNSLMQFRYDLFMPRGILWEFIVLMYRYIENHDWVWRNGVILERGGTKAEIKENLFERRIYLRFSGDNIAEFRAIITDKLDEISQSYHQLKYDKMVPCLCSTCYSSTEPHFFKFSVLKNRQIKRIKPTIECEITGEDVLLTRLLEGFEYIDYDKELLENIAQDTTSPNAGKTVMNFYSRVGNVTGTVEDEQNIKDIHMESDRSTDQSRNINISDDAEVTASGAGALNQGDNHGTIANNLDQEPATSQPEPKFTLTKVITILASIATIIALFFNGIFNTEVKQLFDDWFKQEASKTSQPEQNEIDK